jgi:superfamily I DNA and RNA helicase
MNWHVDLDIIYGSSQHNPALMNGMAKAVNEAGIKGTFYIGYPVMASSDSSVTIDALLVSQTPGFIAFHIAEPDQNYREIQDRLYYVLEANLGRHDSLRSGRKLGVPINIISVFPDGQAPADGTPQYRVATPATLVQDLDGLDPVSDNTLFRNLSAAIQRVTTIKPLKKRATVAKHNSRGAILKSIEKQIANLDRWQKAAAIETPEGPQRIRGLAGSGKTVVLALKAAYLHTQHPDWKIAVTFHTRSLYQQFKDLIERFTFEHMGDKPDWSQLSVVHSWGSSGNDGVYSLACSAINMYPVSFLAAKAKYGAAKAFSGICNELAAVIKGKQLDLYDAILIDEAQDLPPSFFQIVDALTKQPKRIVWAYDELQNLSDASMASAPDLFGREITLTNSPEAPQQDIILPVCYRNTPWALTLAHALGFGLFREPEIVQHFDDPTMWTDIGYQIEDGELTEGHKVTLSRSARSYPAFFSELLNPADAVVSKAFNSREEQYAWIADQIKRNVTEDELDPDDVLIVLPNAISQKDEYYELRRHLDAHDISSNLAGVTSDRDSFASSGIVTVSGIYRAKGNEAPMVYVANADYCATGMEMIRLRNILFTAITRSRAWVRLSGMGSRMVTLQKEINCVVEAGFKLNFKVPTPPELQKVRRINRDRTAQEKGKIRKAERSVEELIELVRQGVISVDAMPQLRELLKAVKDGGEQGER